MRDCFVGIQSQCYFESESGGFVVLLDHKHPQEIHKVAEID